MPIYEYHCADCRKTFELIRPVSKPSRKHGVECPECHGNDTERCWSRVAVDTPNKAYHPAKPLDV